MLIDDSKEIIIVGDGFAAAILVINLLKKGVAASLLTVVGKRVLGAGNAYDCECNSFRLNIREDLPVLFSEDPLHFSRWAKKNIDDSQAVTQAGCFYRRTDFAKYISSLLKEHLAGRSLNRVFDIVTGITGDNDLWTVRLASGRLLRSKKIILATGNAVPRWPCAVETEPGLDQNLNLARIIENPWQGGWLKNLDSKETIIILGGGLTALDAISALYEQSHRGKIYLISPRLVLPPEQALWTRKKQPNWPRELNTVRLIKFIRSYLPSALPSSSEWQSAWEELRPNLSSVWQTFNEKQRRVIMKRVGWIWTLYRFRAAPQTIRAYEKLKAKNQLETIATRANKITLTESKVSVLLANNTLIDGSCVVNCTGSGIDNLNQNLIKERVAIPDALGDSIAVNEDYQVMSTKTCAWQNLFMIGPGTMGSLGDVVALSSVATQADKLSLEIHDRCQTGMSRLQRTPKSAAKDI